MAAPVIVSAALAKTTPLAPGESTTLTVVATDADTRDVTLTIVAKDAAGGQSAPTDVVVRVSDPVTVTVTSSDPSFTVTPVAGQPGVFTVKA